MRAVLTRILALALAVGMVVLALQYRDRNNGPTPPGNGNGNGGGATPVLLCVEELRPACEALADAEDIEVVFQEAGETYDALVAGNDPPEAASGWLTLAPWPEMIDGARAGQRSIFGEQSPPLGTSSLVMAIWRERAERLEAHCDPVNWSCVGNALDGTWADVGGDASWGTLKPAFDDPSKTASGLLVLAQATSSFLDTSDYSLRELESDEYLAWLGDLVNGVETMDDPIAQMLLSRASRVDTVGGLDAEITPELVSAADHDRVEVLRAEPPVEVAVVFVPFFGAPGSELLARVLMRHAPDHLQDAEWNGPAELDDAGLPSADVMGALRRIWQETAR